MSVKKGTVERVIEHVLVHSISLIDHFPKGGGVKKVVVLDGAHHKVEDLPIPQAVVDKLLVDFLAYNPLIWINN